ncbi:MAG: carbamoyltransferase HypF [Candidatus Thermoplasmatota archaeon]|nr:carbamoyltransferase HypF [Candidatus Thermoplasmatota archaeon]
MKLIFKGIVQGVGFRPTIYRIATELGLKGYVLNKGSEVEVVIDRNIENFIEEVKQQLPAIAKISEIITISDEQSYSDFQILHSENGSHESLIPPDVATCEACQQEILCKKNRRYQFPFTNCTICGARFSVITDVPYDRERTAMNDFPLCSTCQTEYQNPLDRRYHAQTISCPQCGPFYNLYNSTGNIIDQNNIIKRFANEIDAGCIGVLKSWGGMHICCTVNEIQRFRKWYQRPQKAFALMVKNISTARSYAQISKKEIEILSSNARPIVLANKLKGESVSPGLNTIGLFLPYTGMHHLLFHYLKTDAIIMTSANIPGEPMLLENNEVFSLHADWYLLHNRKIPNRVDDTVLKIWRETPMFLRKSRGYIPDPITIEYPSNVISVGAGENICGSLSTNQQLYCTQYIGNGAYYKTLEFLDNSLRHLMKLFQNKPNVDGVALDRHPAYSTRQVAQRFAEEFYAPLFEVPHHWAHAVALLTDQQVDEAVVLTLDGLGYGDDGTFWGGDVISATASDYHRVGHLSYMPLIGADRATKDPRRLVYAILPEFAQKMGFSASEITLFEKLKKNSPQCCSFGRYLDALACLLGICCDRTYSGEPAMKLEKYLMMGKPRFSFEVNRSGSIVPADVIFQQLANQIKKPLSDREKADASYAFVKTLIDELVEIAVDYANRHQISYIGITGGVSYNIPILEMVAKKVRQSGLTFLVHKRVPNGDGCISVGQNVIAGNQLRCS